MFFFSFFDAIEEQFHYFSTLHVWNDSSLSAIFRGWYNHTVISFSRLCLSSEVPQKQCDLGNQDIILSDDF